jgi:non-canonical (house-cleaning) NTP pyrophosphatase
MNRIYRVSGLKNAGSASIVARAITALQSNLHVKVDIEGGLVDVQGRVSDYQVARAVRDSGCDYLGPADGAAE